MCVRFVVLGLALVVAACGGDREKKPAKRAKAATPAPRAAEPPPPKPTPLPDGSVCCDARVRSDHLVQVTTIETCAKLEGTHAPVEACWLPDPPQLSGKDYKPAPPAEPATPPATTP